MHLMFIEGPIVAYVAAFSASLGYFNAWVIFLLFVLGNQIPDTLIFEFSRRLKRERVEKFASYFGLEKKRISWIEKNMKKHFKKTTLVTKLVPPFPTPGIIVAGFAKVPFWKFFWTYLIYNIFYAAIFVLLGYYSGIAVNTFVNYFKITEYLLFIVLVLVILIYFIIKKASFKLAKVIKN
jgi:membrane protein DedA with SNARE-associated domain